LKTWLWPDGFIGDDPSSKRNANWLMVMFAGYIALLVLLLMACSGGGDKPYPGRLAPSFGSWTAYGSGTGIVTPLPNPFAIPQASSGKTINYVYTQSMPLAGKTMTLNYSVDGDATFAPLPEPNCGTNGCGPALLRLFIWSANDNGDNPSFGRWWCNGAAKPLVLGANQVLACTVTPTMDWTSVYGQPASTNVQQFTSDVNAPFAAGFTFGGMFAGHGVWTTSGTAVFKINEFAVQ
jgi:hypothetical protein